RMSEQFSCSRQRPLIDGFSDRNEVLDLQLAEALGAVTVFFEQRHYLSMLAAGVRRPEILGGLDPKRGKLDRIERFRLGLRLGLYKREVLEHGIVFEPLHPRRCRLIVFYDRMDLLAVLRGGLRCFLLALGSTRLRHP